MWRGITYWVTEPTGGRGEGGQGRARGERPAKRKQANRLGVIEHD